MHGFTNKKQHTNYVRYQTINVSMRLNIEQFYRIDM